MTARPTTRRSAPAARASRGEATRAWSWVASPGIRIPGTTRTSRSDHGSVAARSGAAHTIPSHPLAAASSQRAPRTSPPATSSLVRTVTPSAPGVATPAATAPTANPSTAARSIGPPPEACTVTQRAPNAPSTRAALPTVLGMSCNFRSQNTSNPASANEVTASGPAAENSSRPTFTVPNQGARRSAVRRAATRSSTSSTRHSRRRTSSGTSWSATGPSHHLVRHLRGVSHAPLRSAPPAVTPRGCRTSGPGRAGSGPEPADRRTWRSPPGRLMRRPAGTARHRLRWPPPRRR